MKRLFLVYTCALVLIATASAQRLPEIATPESYKLIFTPDLAKASFEGDETIQIRMLKPSLEIVLNAAEIDFVDVTVDSAASSQKAKVTLDKEKEQATLAVEKAIQPGQATLRIKYRGILNDQLRGFYLGKQDDGHNYAATQLEATDARRAFPSFDEPAYKATFDVTAVVDKGMTVISNTKSVSEADGPIEGKRTIHFATTPKMSSYLVALVVGNFEYIEGSAEGIPIRLYTSPEKTARGICAGIGRRVSALLQPLFWYQVSLRQAGSGRSFRLRAGGDGKHRVYYLPRILSVARR